MLQKGKSDTTHSSDEGIPLWWVLPALVLIIIAGLVLWPAYKGYGVYKAMKNSDVPSDYLKDMQGLASAKVAAEAQVNETRVELASVSAELVVCREDLSQQKELVESLGKDLVTRGATISDLEKSVRENEEVIENAARRICCVQRVENPAISAFTILDGKISCVTDGGTAITC